MTTSKSPNGVAHVAYEAAKEALPRYGHKFSPHTYTQAQLLACLVLKEFFTTDYRGIVGILKDSRDLRQVLELQSIPHFTTLQKAASHLWKKHPTRMLMQSILKRATGKDHATSLAALDGTGFESHHVSRYYVERKDRIGYEKYQTTTYQRFPKVGIVCDTANHLILCGIPERGPKFDRTHFAPALREATLHTRITTLVADAGYDGEPQHALAREWFGIRTIIPPFGGRPTHNLPTGRYRREMALTFDWKLYGQRWQGETVISMVKRRMGSFLRARSYWSQCREILLRLFTHNVMIVLPTVPS